MRFSFEKAKTNVRAILFELVSKMSKSAVFADVILSDVANCTSFRV